MQIKWLMLLKLTVVPCSNLNERLLVHLWLKTKTRRISLLEFSQHIAMSYDHGGEYISFSVAFF